MAGSSTKRGTRVRVVAIAALLAAFAGAAPACAQELAPAPSRHEPQDVAAWSKALTPKAAKTRDQVAALYQSVYVPGASVPLAWSGALAACDPGTTDMAHQQAVVDRINYYRALADLPAVTLLGAPQTAGEQAAALMMAANNALSHTPPPSWTCYGAVGAAAAGESNIALGAQGVEAIDLYMDDSGEGNAEAGHRRWLLYPPRAAMATGDVPGAPFGASTYPANALYVFGPSTTRPATPNGIAWPPAGYVPWQNLPAESNRWSFSFPGADFSNASVSLAGPAGPIPVTYEAIADGFGDNTLVFLPAAMSYAKPAADTTYQVSVTGMSGPNVPSSVQYAVTVIDPDAVAPAATTVDVVEFYNAALDHYFITWNASEIANLDAGRTPTPWTRTGVTFKAWASALPGTSDTCRYYIPPELGDSHFFGRGTAECTATGLAHPSFVLEDAHFMQMKLPVAGACPAGSVPVYRVFSNRPDANHRYMIDPAVRDQMVARGWLAEGDGPDLVVMCAPG